MKKLGIKIIGSAASGKSALAFAIKDMLDKYKINCVITGSEDEISGKMEKEWQKRLLSLELVKVKTIRIR